MTNYFTKKDYVIQNKDALGMLSFFVTKWRVYE